MYRNGDFYFYSEFNKTKQIKLQRYIIAYRKLTFKNNITAFSIRKDLQYTNSSELHTRIKLPHKYHQNDSAKGFYHSFYVIHPS